MVMWIIGMSGAGKTTLASEVVTRIRQNGKSVVLIDGDIIREVFGGNLGHSIDERRINADRICRLCKFLDDQKIDVVCAVLSIFHESQLWNRENLTHYYQVFIDTPLDQLMARDSKHLYFAAKNGQIKNVVGVDIDFPIPVQNDLVIKNSENREALLSWASSLCEQFMREADDQN